jgi:hypothetical protein
MLPVQAAALGLVFGASRATALSTIFIYWILFQLTTFLVVRRLTGDTSSAWAALALLLALRTPFLPAGGVADFRLDFVAMCLLGVHAGLVAASGVFADRRLSLAAGGAAGLLLLSRYLAGVYLAGIWLCTAAVLLWLAVRAARPSRVRDLSIRRLANLALSGAAVALIAGPSLYRSRLAIYSYYLDPRIDHGLWGHAGADRWSGLWLQARMLWEGHLGPSFIAVAALAIAVALLGPRPDPLPPPRGTDHACGAFFACCLLVPMAVLALYPGKSVSASGIAVPGVVAIVCLAAHAAARRARGGTGRAVVVARGAVAALAGVVGVANQVQGYAARFVPREGRAAVRDAVALYDAIGRHCERAGWRRPRLAVNALRDDLANGGLPLTALYYERHGVLLDVDATLGASVAGVDAARLREALARTDVLILVPDAEGPHSHFRFSSDMRRLRPQIDAIVAQRFLLLERHAVGGEPVDVYVRPEVRVSGVSGDWLTSAGVSLSVPMAIPGGSTLVLRGLYPDPALAPGFASGLEARGRLVPDAGPVTPVATRLEVSGARYELQVLLPTVLPSPEGWRVDVSFSKFFVPGPSDPRELVIGRPAETAVRLP